MPDREKVINGLESCVVSKTKCFFNRNEMCPYFHVDVLCCEQELMRDALALLKEQQENRLEIASEMVKGSVLMYQGKELVRCKDCKYGNVTFNGIVLCSKGGKHEPDWFCADGERKTDDG